MCRIGPALLPWPLRHPCQERRGEETAATQDSKLTDSLPLDRPPIGAMPSLGFCGLLIMGSPRCASGRLARWYPGAIAQHPERKQRDRSHGRLLIKGNRELAGRLSGKEREPHAFPSIAAQGDGRARRQEVLDSPALGGQRGAQLGVWRIATAGRTCACLPSSIPPNSQVMRALACVPQRHLPSLPGGYRTEAATPVAALSSDRELPRRAAELAAELGAVAPIRPALASCSRASRNQRPGWLGWLPPQRSRWPQASRADQTHQVAGDQIR
jgi:hypothetical protein